MKKLRRLRVYEKGGPSVFKNFQFISQLFDCALHYMSHNNCLMVCSIFSTMLRSTEIIVAT